MHARVFPDACPRAAAANLSSQLKDTSPGTALERIINRYLEHGVAKAEKVQHAERKPDPPQDIEEPTDIRARADVHGDGTRNHVEQQVDMGSVAVPPETQANYALWSVYTLTKEFPRHPAKELKRVFQENNNRFSSSYGAISSTYTAALAAEQNGQVRKRGRRSGHPGLNLPSLDKRDELSKPDEPCYHFEREWQNIQNAFREGAGEASSGLKKVAGLQSGTDGTDMNTCEGERAGNIECGCCCSEYRFEEMAQCAEGRLFCFTCLRRRVEESTFGGAQACTSLPCMDTCGCEEIFPWSEVKRALPPDVLAKYEQRQAEDAVVQAKITGLRMTKALLRVCSACKAELLKSGGCNKVKRRCGETMCYVCREPIAANYRHFCQHARSGPNQNCTVCKKCSLWEEGR